MSKPHKYIVYNSTAPEDAGLTWTTEPPKCKGWYWAYWHHPKNDKPHVVYINDQLQFHDTLPYDDEGIWRPVSEYLTPYGVAWLGPLPEPQKPEA